jgi:hypothetical protein
MGLPPPTPAASIIDASRSLDIRGLLFINVGKDGRSSFFSVPMQQFG